MTPGLPTSQYEDIQIKPITKEQAEQGTKVNLPIIITGDKRREAAKTIEQYPAFQVKTEDIIEEPKGSDVKVAGQIIRYIPIRDLAQMTLDEFKDTVRNPTEREQERYLLTPNGFGHINGDSLRRIYEYGKNNGWEAYKK